jgi:hypothetical protein
MPVGTYPGIQPTTARKTGDLLALTDVLGAKAEKSNGSFGEIGLTPFSLL